MKLHAPSPETKDVLTPIIMDEMAFLNQLHHLSKGKATGPDGLANDTISAAPTELKRLLHTFLCCLWKAAYTPTCWAKSHTCLLYKRGDNRDLGSYRPIAMANILGKIWTGTLARALAYFAETRHILSTTQEGFRTKKNSLRQVRNVVNAIEDAHLHHKNIYLLFVDFSNAFNTVQHLTLQLIMQWEGIPPHMCRCVASLYANASTQIITPAGLTAEIPITRGTLQGDTLSPLLFLLYLEPLLRWLHQGNRGYHFGCLSPAANAQHQLSGAAFADDLATITNNIQDMQKQALKITLFAAWADLGINNSKCAVTAGLFQEWHITQKGISLQDINVQHQLEGTIHLGGKPVPHLLPGETYTYLGIPLNTRLQWKTTLQQILQKIKAKT